MMEFIRNWITGICGAAILLAVFCAISPKTSTTRMLRLCGSILLVFSVFAPIYSLDSNAALEQLESLKLPNELSVEEIKLTNEDLKASIIERQLTAYILQRAKQLGIDCEVRIGFKKNSQGQSIPEHIWISCADADQREMFDMIKNECGIEPDFHTTGNERVKE